MSSVLRVSELTASDLRHLGNNVLPVSRQRHQDVGAINRALACFGESVARLYSTRRPAGRRVRTRRAA